MKLSPRMIGALCALALAAASWAQATTLDTGPPTSQTLSVEEIVARLSERPGERSMFADREGEAFVARGSVQRGAVVLAKPVRHARTGYLRNNIRLDGSGEIVLPSGTAVFERIARAGESQERPARAWCAVVADGENPRTLCLLPSPPGGAIVAAQGGSPYAPSSLAPAASPSNIARVDEDPAAASTFPRMEMVYSFVRWDDAFMYLEQGLRIDGRIIKIADVRAPREPTSAFLNAGRGALRLRPGADPHRAVATASTPRAEEADHLRQAAEAIVRLPPGEGAAASPELLDPTNAARPATQAAPTPSLPVARVALPGPEPDRCMMAVNEASSPGQTLRLAPGLFRQRPTGDDFGRYFPRAAVEAGLDGRAVLVCAIDHEGELRCLVQSETPAGYGFGEAALKISSRFRVSERLPDGRATAGGALRLPIRFCLPGG